VSLCKCLCVNITMLVENKGDIKLIIWNTVIFVIRVIVLLVLVEF
jgi:hypothetical protein